MILFDLPVYQFLISLFSTNTIIVNIMKLITSLGSTLVIVTGILCVAILFKNKKYFFTFVFANGIGVIISNLIKIIVERDRPSNTMLFTYEDSYSFPSGHTMMSTIFYGLIIYYVYTNVKNKSLKYFLIGLLSSIIFLIGISRIYLGVHYATDVVGGFIFGLVYLIVFIKFLRKYEKKRNTHK